MSIGSSLISKIGSKLGAKTATTATSTIAKKEGMGTLTKIGLGVGGFTVLSSIMGGSGGTNPISAVVDTVSSTFSMLPTIVPLALVGAGVFYLTK